MSEFFNLPLFGISLTLGAYFLAKEIRSKFNYILLNPVLIAILCIILVLSVFKIDYAAYNIGGKFLGFFLGPSVVALGVLFYEKYAHIKHNLFPFLLAVSIGGILCIISISSIALILILPDFIIKSIIPMSVTTPIAIEISKVIGGVPAITAGVVILIGIFGNAFGPSILKIFNIKDTRAIGTALGTASHGIGTARAFEFGNLAGSFSGLAMCINGLFTAVITPPIINYLLVNIN